MVAFGAAGFGGFDQRVEAFAVDGAGFEELTGGSDVVSVGPGKAQAGFDLAVDASGQHPGDSVLF